MGMLIMVSGHFPRGTCGLPGDLPVSREPCAGKVAAAARGGRPGLDGWDGVEPAVLMGPVTGLVSAIRRVGLVSGAISPFGDSRLVRFTNSCTTVRSHK